MDKNNFYKKADKQDKTLRTYDELFSQHKLNYFLFRAF